MPVLMEELCEEDVSYVVFLYLWEGQLGRRRHEVFSEIDEVQVLLKQWQTQVVGVQSQIGPVLTV